MGKPKHSNDHRGEMKGAQQHDEGQYGPKAFQAKWAEITDQLREWVRDGRLRYRIHTFEGLESAPDALNAMFTGENTGKIVVQVKR